MLLIFFIVLLISFEKAPNTFPVKWNIISFWKNFIREKSFKLSDNNKKIKHIIQKIIEKI